MMTVTRRTSEKDAKIILYEVLQFFLQRLNAFLKEAERGQDTQTKLQDISRKINDLAKHVLTEEKNLKIISTSLYAVVASQKRVVKSTKTREQIVLKQIKEFTVHIKNKIEIKKIKRVSKKKLLQRIKAKEEEAIIMRKLFSNDLLLQMITIETKEKMKKQQE